MFSLKYTVLLLTPVTAGAGQRGDRNGSTLNWQRSLGLVFDVSAGTGNRARLLVCARRWKRDMIDRYRSFIGTSL
jgi:hypothetical protein